MVVFSIKEDLIVDQTKGQVLVLMRDVEEMAETIHRLRDAGLDLAPEVHSEARLRYLVESDAFPAGVRVVVSEYHLWSIFTAESVLPALARKIDPARSQKYLFVLFTGEEAHDCIRVAEAVGEWAISFSYVRRKYDGTDNLVDVITRWFESSALDDTNQ